MNVTHNLAVLFDFDGVIVDSETQYTVFWNEQGRKFHPEIADFGLLIKGQTLTQIYERYFAHQEAVQREITAALDAFETRMSFDYIPGVETFLHELREQGIPSAIVTSSNDKKMANAYRAHPELQTSVDRILTADHFTHSKPHPECFLLGAETLGLAPAQCVVFEDSFHGLEAGNRAGMTVIGLATTNPAERIAPWAKAVIPDFRGFTVEKMKEIMGNVQING